MLSDAIEVLAPLGVCGIVGAPAPDAEVSMNILTAIVKGSSVVGINAAPGTVVIAATDTGSAARRSNTSGRA